MKPEALARIAQDLRWRVGLLVFAVLGSVGGVCALWALQDVRSSGARMAGRQAGALAQSVAQTLALQLGAPCTRARRCRLSPPWPPSLPPRCGAMPRWRIWPSRRTPAPCSMPLATRRVPQRPMWCAPPSRRASGAPGRAR